MFGIFAQRLGGFLDDFINAPGTQFVTNLGLFGCPAIASGERSLSIGWSTHGSFAAVPLLTRRGIRLRVKACSWAAEESYRHNVAGGAGFHDTAWKSSLQGSLRFPPPRSQGACESRICCVLGDKLGVVQMIGWF